MSKTLISVIIPVYNCDRYLVECLDSVVCQTLQEMEIIIVNDCSTDGSQEIIDKYSLSDGRIRSVELENNSGVGFARNAGMDIAEGEYLLFLDADDYWADCKMLEYLYETATGNRAELVKFGYYKVDEAGRRKIHQIDMPRTIDLRTDKSWRFSYSPWSLLISRDLVNRNNIRFDTRLVVSEDALFNCTLYCHASTLTYLDKLYYCYRFERDGCASKGEWSTDRLFCTVLWLRSAIEVITSSPVGRTHPHLLQLVICERLARLTVRFIKVATEILDEDQFREYIHQWAICLGYLNRGFLEKVGFTNKRVFPGDSADRYRNVLTMVQAEDLDELRNTYDA